MPVEVRLRGGHRVVADRGTGRRNVTLSDKDLDSRDKPVGGRLVAYKGTRGCKGIV